MVDTPKKKASRSPARTPVRSTSPARETAGREDRSFGDVLRTKSVERIMPDLMNRVEGGRRAQMRAGVNQLEAELSLLREERKRLETAAGIDRNQIARVDAVLRAVEADAVAQRAAVAELDRVVLHQAGGWTVVGRVLDRRGAPLGKATVEFVSGDQQAVRELGSVPVDADGRVRKAYAAEIIAKLQGRGLTVSAAVRVGQRVVMADNARVKVAPDTIYQFDLRADLTD